MSFSVRSILLASVFFAIPLLYFYTSANNHLTFSNPPDCSHCLQAIRSLNSIAEKLASHTATSADESNLNISPSVHSSPEQLSSNPPSCPEKSESKTASFTSAFSPGLSFCTANPFLIGYDWKQIEQLESRWLEWKETQFHAMYKLMQEYYFSEKHDPSDVKNEGHFVYSNPIGQHLHRVIYPEDAPLPCPYSKGMKGYGKGAGNRKFLCGLDEYPSIIERHRKKYPEFYQNRNESSTACNMFSLGSNNLFSFEDEISRQTKCNIYTFDCTSEPPKTNIERLFFQKRCLGEPTPAGEPTQNLQLKLFPYRRPPPRWNSAKERQYIEKVKLEAYFGIMNDLGLDHVDILKIDVEGAEYAVFVDLLKRGNTRAPYQISFESHWWHRDLGHALLTQTLFEEFWRLGYRITYRDDQNDKSCFEWSLMRVFC